MQEQASRKMISDAQWKQLEEAIKKAKHSQAGAPPEQDDREFLEAVLWIARTGSPWRDLPSELGYWHAVYMRFRRWETRGVWKNLWEALQAKEFVGARRLFIDSTTVRAHQHAAGAPKKGLKPGSGTLSWGPDYQDSRGLPG
jgi:transposase